MPSLAAISFLSIQVQLGASTDLVEDLGVADGVVDDANRSQVVHNLVVRGPEQVVASVLAPSIPSPRRTQRL